MAVPFACLVCFMCGMLAGVLIDMYVNRERSITLFERPEDRDTSDDWLNPSSNATINVEANMMRSLTATRRPNKLQ